MKFIITESKIYDTFVTYMDSIHDLHFNAPSKEFITKSNEVFGWVSKNVNYSEDGYAFLINYNFLNVLEGYFGNNINNLLLKYFKNKFPDILIYLIL
jgi:hypothetical protein